MWWKQPVLVFSLITLGLYFFSFFNQFVWDDEQFIYRNAYVSNFAVKEIFTTNTIAGAGEISNYYRPLTTLSFAWDYQFWGLNPFGYHITNTLLHLACGILIYYLLIRLKFNNQLSFSTALIFLVHPVQTEAVTYINSRGDSLYTFFLLLSLLLHTYLFEGKTLIFNLYNSRLEIKKIYLTIVVVITYLASILSKEIALAGLGLHGLLIARYLFLEIGERKKIFSYFPIFIKKNLLSVISFTNNILIVIVYLYLRSSILNFVNTFNFFDDQSLYSESLLVRLLTFFKIIFIYLRLLVIPYPLHMERNVSIIEHVFNPWLGGFILLISLLAYVSIKQWKKQRKTDIIFGWAWAAIMLVPVSGIIAINGLMYEHWLYLPLVGFCIVGYNLIELFNPRLLLKNVTKHFFIGFVSALVLLTVIQNYYWSSPITLYTHLLKYTDSARIHNNLAMAYSEKGNRKDALAEYQKAIDFGMAYPQIYHNMGNTYRDMGNIEAAQNSYEKALQIDPTFHFTYINLTQIYLQQKKYDQALDIVHMAQKYYPNTVEYQLLELQVLQQSGNQQAFDAKKATLLKQFSQNPLVVNSVNSLQFSQ